MEYTERISSLSAIQFTVEKSSDSQRLIEMVFVVQLQTLHEIPHRKTVLENLTGELNATNIK